MYTAWGGACDPASSLRAQLQEWEEEKLAIKSTTIKSHNCKYLWKFQILKTCSAQLEQQIWDDFDPMLYISTYFSKNVCQGLYKL